jgi:purine nucleosidase
MAKFRTILDTDIGSDVDDAMALAFMLASPEFAIEGVTVVTGDVLLRARIAMKLLRLAGRSEIPVMLGAAKPMLEHRPLWLTGDESSLVGAGDEVAANPESAPAFIARTIIASPGEIHVAAVAPLTNIAMAMLLEPRVASRVAHIWIMGGAIRGPERFHLGPSESNIDYDPMASRIVFASGAPISFVPLDVTLQVPFDRTHSETIRAAGSPLQREIADQFDSFYHVRRNGETHMHDPLTAALMLRPSLATWRELDVAIDVRSDIALGAMVIREPTTGSSATVRGATSVQADAARTFLLERLVAR